MSSDKVGISDVNFVADLVRQQGEELLRLRKELETTQKVNAASIDALRAAERHIEDLQQNCSQWRLRFLNIRLELDALQTENDSMASQLEATRADLRTGLDFANLSESFVEPQQPIEERAPSSSTSIAAAEESDLDGYTSISFRDIASSSTSSVIGRPDVTDCPIPNRAASDDWLEVGACGLDYAASTVSESNRDEEKVSHAGTEILISDEEVRLERPRVLDADKNETPKSDISEAATVDLDEQNDDVSVNPFTEQFMSESLDGIPRHVNHLARSLSVEYLKPVCSRLTNTTNKVVDALCLRALGPAAETSYYVLKVPQALLAYPNINNGTLITVSKSANNLSYNLTKLKSGWKGHVLLQPMNSAGELYYLGEYESGGGRRMTYSEYGLLPEETKLYIFNLANALRPQNIHTIAQVALDMSKDTGIYIAKTELRFIGYSAIVENQLGKEARQEKDAW